MFSFILSQFGNGYPNLSVSCHIQLVHAFPTSPQPSADPLHSVATQMTPGKVVGFVTCDCKRIFQLCFRDL